MIDGSQHTVSVPAGASYFNPVESSAVEAPVVIPKFKVMLAVLYNHGIFSGLVPGSNHDIDSFSDTICRTHA